MPAVEGPEELVADVEAPGEREEAFRSADEVLYAWVDGGGDIVRTQTVAAIGDSWVTTDTATCP